MDTQFKRRNRVFFLSLSDVRPRQSYPISGVLPEASQKSALLESVSFEPGQLFRKSSQTGGTISLDNSLNYLQ